MAYKKTYKKTYKKKRGDAATRKWAKRGATAATVAYKAYRLARRIKDAVNTEYKTHDVKLNLVKLGSGENNPAVADSVVFWNLAEINQGVKDGQRVGDSLKLQRLTARGSIGWLSQPTGARSALVRVIIMRGKADNGRIYNTVIGSTPFLETSGVFGAKNETTKYETKILHDHTYTLDTARKNIITFDWNYPLNWHVNYWKDGTGEQIQDGGLYIAIVTNTGTTAEVAFYSDFGISYTDN